MISRADAPHFVWGEHCESWHLLTRPDLSVVYERLPPGTSERRHQHPKTRQFLYVLKGTASLVMDGRRVTVATGQGAEVLPGSHHELGNAGDQDLEFLVISHPHRRGEGTPVAKAAGVTASVAVNDGYVRLSASGWLLAGELVAVFERALRECLAAGVNRVLVDVSLLSHAPLTTAQRYDVTSRVAEFWPREIRIVIKARPDQIDPERFVALVARNRGLDVSSHSNEEEAIADLLRADSPVTAGPPKEAPHGEIETRDGHVCVRLAGRGAPRDVLPTLQRAVDRCREAGVKRLLVDFRGFGHDAVTAVTLYELASGIAEFWPRDMKFASLIRPDQIDPERFGLLVARNRGIEAAEHTTEAEAVKWLLEG